jgi:hypothetical protein
MGADHRQAQVTADNRRDWWQLDFVVFTNDFAHKAIIEFAQASRAVGRAVCHGFVGIIRQRAEMALVSWFGAAGFRIPTPFLLVARRRLRRGPRGLRRALKFQHQLHQLLFAQAFKIIAIHTPSDSEIAGPRKGG